MVWTVRTRISYRQDSAGCCSSTLLSTTGKLVVWGPVVWIPGIPLWKGLLLRGTPGSSQTTNLPFADSHLGRKPAGNCLRFLWTSPSYATPLTSPNLFQKLCANKYWGNQQPGYSCHCTTNPTPPKKMHYHTGIHTQLHKITIHYIDIAWFPQKWVM